MSNTDAGLLFERDIALPATELDDLARRLVGFRNRYDRLRRDLALLVGGDRIADWSRKYHRQVLPVVKVLQDRVPLVVFFGDVGTGKTVTAMSAASQLATEFDPEGKREWRLFALSTRVRGAGLVGQMSALINEAFGVLHKHLAKHNHAILILDEGDTLAASRAIEQSHHEDKAGVNTLIQKLDAARMYGGRLLVIIVTNRVGAIDPAIVRRAALLEEFKRPTADERRELFRMDCEGIELTNEQLEVLVSLTGPDEPAGRNLGHTFSDLRFRVLKEAVARAFPARAMVGEDLIEAARATLPSPSLEQ